MVTADTARRSSAPSTYVAMLRAGFQAAARARGCLRRDLVVGDRTLRLRFAGPGLLEPLSQVLAHLEADAPEATTAAEVMLWDSASTGVPLPPVPWRDDELEDHGQSRGYRVRGWDAERVYTLHDRDYGAITLFDAGSRTAVFATRDAAAVPAYERAAPLRVVLHWALSEPDRHLLHGGVVAGEAGGVLIAGRSGSGKSTLVLCCMRAGMRTLGDDYVLVDAASLRAHALHSTVKLNEDGAAWLPELRTAILARDPTDSGKVVLDLHRQRPDALLRETALRAIVLPHVRAGAPTRVRPASAAEAARALAPSTVLQHFGHAAAGMATVAALLRRVPAYAIEQGRDMDAAVEAVAALAAGSEP